MPAAYPSIQRQFADAVPVRPFTRTGRMQRRLSVAAGEDWAALPFTASFLDPWLSPGIAHTLFGVERLTRILGEAASKLSISCEAARLMFAYHWPRNIRELENCLHAATVLAGNAHIELEHLPQELREPPTTNA